MEMKHIRAMCDNRLKELRVYIEQIIKIEGNDNFIKKLIAKSRKKHNKILNKEIRKKNK